MLTARRHADALTRSPDAIESWTRRVMRLVEEGRHEPTPPWPAAEHDEQGPGTVARRVRALEEAIGHWRAELLACRRELTAAEARERTLRDELDHRVRNNLASLVGLIGISSSGATSVEAFEEALTGRVRMAAWLHTLRSECSWTSIDLRQLVADLSVHFARGRIDGLGPVVPISVHQIEAVGMLLHELTTGSAARGVLERPDGRIEITWHSAGEHPGGRRCLELTYRDRGGRAVEAMPAPGRTLIERLVRSELGGGIEWGLLPSGAHHRCSLVLEAADPLPPQDHGDAGCPSRSGMSARM